MSASDNTFAQMIDNAISKNPYLAHRKLRVETHDGRVVLLGTVGTYYQKQMAQEAVRRVDGVQAIDNRLTVLA
jgi:osmotically-inducible protein OsmY